MPEVKKIGSCKELVESAAIRVPALLHLTGKNWAQFENVFLVSSILPKKTKKFVRFLGELKTPKRIFSKLNDL